MKNQTKTKLLCLATAFGCAGAGFADIGSLRLQKGQNPFVQATGIEKEAFAPFPFRQSRPSEGTGRKTRRPAARPFGSQAQDASCVYGMTWADDAIPMLYSISPADGEFVRKWASSYAFTGNAEIRQMWHMPDDGKVGALVKTAPNSWSTAIYYIEYDFTDGTNSEPVKNYFAYSLPKFNSSVAYNPEDGCIYGYGANDYGTDLMSFAKADVGAIREGNKQSDAVKLIKSLTSDEYASERCNAIAYYAVENCFYGINAEGSLVRIGLDGNQKKVAEITVPAGIDADKMCGMTWSPSDNAFILSGYAADGGAALVAVGLDGSQRILADDPERTYPFMMSTEMAIDDNSPLSPVMTAYDFPQGSLKGTVSFRLPEKTRGGAALSGTLRYNVSYVVTDPDTGAERTVRLEGESAPGKEISIEAEVGEAGYYEFAAQALSDRESQIGYSTIWIGPDTPVAPAHSAVQVLSGDPDNPVWGFAWAPVTESVHGGYIDTDEIVYNIYVMSKEGVLYDSKGLPTTDKPAATSKGNDINYISWNVPEIMGTYSKTYYCIIVTASYLGNESEGVSSAYDNSMVSHGGPWIIDEHGRNMSSPLDITLWSYQCSDNAQVVPNAQDDHGIYPFAIWTMPKTTAGSDAWLFTPAVTIKGNTDGLYVLALSDASANTMSGWWNQGIEAFIGDAPTPAAMKTRFMDMTPADKDANIGYMYVPEDLENKYIGIHIVQGASYGYTLMHGLIVAFDKDYDPAKTLMAPEIEIVPADGGNMSYKAVVKCPNRYANGEPVKSPDSYRRFVLKVYDPVTQKDIPLPDKFGDRQPGFDYDAFKVNVDNSRDQYISAYVEYTPTNADPVVSLPATAKTYVGYALPGPIRNLRIEESEDNLSATLRWDAPEAPISDGEYDPKKLTYIVQPAFDGILHRPILTDKNEYVFSVAPGSQPGEIIGDVNVINHDIYAPDELSNTRNAMIGVPQSLPMEERFEENQLAYEPYITPITYSKLADGLMWQLVDPAYISEDMRTDNNEAIVCSMSPNFETGISGQAELPKFSTEGFDNVFFDLTVWTGAWKADTEILVNAYGFDAPMTIGRVPGGDGYQTVRFKLPRSVMNKKWVAIRLKPTFPTQQNVLVIPAYSITSESGVTLLEAEGRRSVVSGKGSLTLLGYKGLDVKIFSLSGELAADLKAASDEEAVSLVPGIYIIRSAGKSVKAMVK